MIKLENEITYQHILQHLTNSEWDSKNINVDVLRLDKLHAVVSGNKLFKLKLPIDKALQTGVQTIITTGGLYSNHLIATAYACNAAGLNSVGIIKAHHPIKLTATLQDCVALGMELIFMLPAAFNDAETLQEKISTYNNNLWIDMGGYSVDGAQGCKEILSIVDTKKYTHIVTAVGTGTTLVGLCLAAALHQKIIGISGMKGNYALQDSIKALLENNIHAPFNLLHNFHFGGFAKYSTALIDFMNTLYKQHQLPTDIVYTGKVFYAICTLINTDYFPAHSKLLIVHTGGLQGNRSLPTNTLLF